MAKKKLVKPASKNAKPRNQSERTIQYVAGAVVVLVLGFFAWQYIPWSNLSADDATATTSGQGSVCALFDSIPAAEQYSSAPEQLISDSGTYFANFEMENGGKFKIQLFADKAPITVNSFIFLSCKGFYDGVTFHRVLDGFMAQGGDPTGTGTGGPGYSFQDEFSDLAFDRAGLLAMANSGPNTNGSQFFITFAETPHLTNLHTIFGEVVEGMDVVNAITRRDPSTGATEPGDAISTITITEE